MIGIVSDHEAFCKTVERLLRTGGWHNILVMPPEWEQLQSRIAPSAPLILDGYLTATSGIRKGALTLIRRLRSDPTWRYGGLILLLVYESVMLLGQWPDADILATKSVEVLQMPFEVTTFQTILASASPLSDAEWDELHLRLEPRSVADLVDKLDHTYANAFSTALSELEQLERLDESLNLDTQWVHRTIQFVRSRLTEKQLSVFFSDLRTLSMQAARLNLLDETSSLEQLDSQITRMTQWVPLVTLHRGEKLEEVVRAAHEVRALLEELLDYIITIKEIVTKEAKSGC
jgi:hypothetical protein